MNVHNKFVCYITLEGKCLAGTNTLTCWAHAEVTKKIKCFEYASDSNPPSAYVTKLFSPSLTLLINTGHSVRFLERYRLTYTLILEVSKKTGHGQTH